MRNILLASALLVGTLPVAGHADSLSGIIGRGTGCTYSSANGGSISCSGGFSTAPAVTYTASGALAAPAANTNTLAIVNCASTCAMTLAAGTTDRQPYYIKRYGAGSVTVTANIDGTAGTMLTANSTTLKEMLHLEWNAALGTWLVGA